MAVVIRNIISGLVVAHLSAILGCAYLDSTTLDLTRFNLGDGWASADKLHRQGVAHLDCGCPKLAEAKFAKAIAVNHGHGGAHNNLGMLHFGRRELYEAATHFGYAIEFLPDNPSPINNLGMVLEAAGKFEEAIELYQQANELDPVNPLYLGNLVRTKIRLGENDELVIAQLQDLMLIETRKPWVDWADEQLAIFLNPMLDRGPSADEELRTPSESKKPKNDEPIRFPPKEDSDSATPDDRKRDKPQDESTADPVPQLQPMRVELQTLQPAHPVFAEQDTGVFEPKVARRPLAKSSRPRRDLSEHEDQKPKRTPVARTIDNPVVGDSETPSDRSVIGKLFGGGPTTLDAR